MLEMILPNLLPSLPHLLVISLTSSIAYLCCLLIYRLFLSPLSAFPGPKIAAATSWYEIYYDWWLGGQYIFKIQQLHEQYGPILRVNPTELSISDPAFYSKIYVGDSVRRTETHDAFAQGLNFDGSFFLTKDHDLHRNRRKPFEKYFSKKGVSSAHGVLVDVVAKFEARLRALEGSGAVVRLDHAIACCTGDIIARMCFGDMGDEKFEDFLDDEGFAKGWYEVLHGMVSQVPMLAAFPWLGGVLKWIPETFLLRVFPEGQAFKTFAETARQKIRKVMSTSNPGTNTHTTSVFHDILSSNMPASEKTEDRLAIEAQAVMAAGTVTSARTIVMAAYYILEDPDLRYRLETELEPVMSTWPNHPPTMSDLEKIPLLQAIVKEALRLSYGVMHRLPRVSPDAPIWYKNWKIPPGTPIGLSAYLTHHTPTVFPSSHLFLPSRWLTGDTALLNQHLVPFSRGSRNCLGANLAIAETNLILAMLFRRGGPQLRLFETDESDVTLVRDFLIPLPRRGTKGIRVEVLGGVGG